MTGDAEEFVVRIRGDASGGVRAFEETEAAGAAMEKSVAKSGGRVRDDLDRTTKTTRKLGDESRKTAKSVQSDFEKMTGASRSTEAAFRRNFTGSNTVAQAFDHTIRELTAQQKVLGTLYNKTGDDKFLVRMKQARKDAEALTRASRDLGTTLEKDVAKGASDAGGMLADLGPIVASLLAIFSPLIGGGIAGAILGGMGLGGIAAGIAGQLHSPQVTGALDQFETDLKAHFTDATAAFAPELEASLGVLDKDMQPFWDAMTKGFTELAPYLKVLSDGFARFMNEFGPGIEAAFKGAEPVLTAIAVMLPSMGQALTVFFQQLQAGSTGAAEAIGLIMHGIEIAIITTGYILRGLANSVDFVFSAIIKILDGLANLPDSLGGDKFKRMADGMRSFQTQVATATPAMDGLAGSIETANDAIEKQTAAVSAMQQEWNDAADAAMSYDNTTLRAIEANQALSKSIKENGHDWDMTHKKGQANWHALLDNIAAEKDKYDADVKLHGVTKANTTAYQAAIDKLLAQAKAAGLSKDQIDLLRQQYENLGKTLDKLNGKRAVFTIQGNIVGTVPGSARTSIASVLANSGVHQFANSGVAGDVPHFDLTGVYAGRPGGVYRFAEASTKREALVAENGDPGRAMSTLRAAAAWHDAVVVTASGSDTTARAGRSGGGGSVGAPIVVDATIMIDGRQVARAIVPAVRRINGRSATDIYTGS
jgi:hypothetical protein